MWRALHLLGDVVGLEPLLVEGLGVGLPGREQRLDLLLADLEARRRAAGVQRDDRELHALELAPDGLVRLGLRDPGLGREQAQQLGGEQPLALLLDEVALVPVLVLGVSLEGLAVEAPVLAAEDPGRAHDSLDLLLRDRQAEGLGLEREQAAIDQGLDRELVEAVPHGAGVVALADALLDLLLAALADALEIVAVVLVAADLDDGAGAAAPGAAGRCR